MDLTGLARALTQSVGTRTFSVTFASFSREGSW